MEQEGKSCQVRRVGSVTFGITLICYGILFLVRIFVPTLHYHVIFQCWPVVFILLGIEILVENRRGRDQTQKFIYDFAAIFMMAGMLFFAMIMAVVDYENYPGGCRGVCSFIILHRRSLSWQGTGGLPDPTGCRGSYP